MKSVASPGRGILAIDGSNATCGKRLSSIGLDNTEVATVLLLFTLSGPVKASTYLVRRTACKSLGALAKFSTQYTEKALDLLMDMMNDDTEAVRLQALEALFRMATYGF
ncbi:Fructose-bisphosphate aldolase 3, chloroplastic [Zea mays]|uniref:fructose-bisphosphate aldolase n=1 Tax=Zea mays TaxID=4577 RepID=A0A3L6FM01_MAIZE|nr:Fructose-bisphosphate aldolase 3, chloroplastic [Zea mays]